MQCGSTVAYTGAVTRAVALLLVLVTACVHSGEVACEDGRTCPPGNTCDLANHRCLAPDQTIACIGRADGTTCTTAAFAGFCQAGACERVECGDGLRTGPEVCDGADLGSATCLTAGFYAGDAVSCTQACTLDTSGCSGRCGDALVNGDELCDGAPPAGTCVDFGFDAGPLGCSSECSAEFAACDAIGWRPEPTPLDAIVDLAGSSPDELWAVGSLGRDGAIIRYSGRAWHLVATEPGLLLQAVAEAAPDDVWALGGPRTGATTVVHVVGGQASIVTDAPTTQPRGLLALSPTDVYLATADAGIQRWDGAAWHAVGSLPGPLRLVAGQRDTDLWTADASGTPQHWDGTAWTPSPAGMAVAQLVPLPSGSVWALGTTTPQIGAPAAVARFDGVGWTAMTPTTTVSLRSIAVSNDNDVWLMDGNGAGLHFDGARWATSGGAIDVNRNASMTAMRPVAGTVVGVSALGVAYRYTGQLFARIDTGNAGLLRGIQTLPGGEIIAANAAGDVLHYDGRKWSQQRVGAPPNGVTLLFATRADDIWVIDEGARALRQFDGATWATRATDTAVSSVWAASPTDAYLGGRAGVEHWDGLSFVTVLLPLPGGTSRVTGRSATDVWMLNTAIGVGSDLYHWDGAALGPAVHVDAQITALVAAGPNSVFALANMTHVMHYDGASWTEIALPSPQPLSGLAATAPDDVFAASPSSLFHYDGSQWSPVRVPADPGIGQATIQDISAIPGAFDIGFQQEIFEQPVRRLLQTRPLACRAHETNCGDGVDDDCDGLVDGFDPDCAL